MDDDDRALFERGLRHATEHHSGAALDLALEELGWNDALEDDRRASISLLFGLQGAADATSGALGLVVRTALGLGPSADAALVLPGVDSWDPPGSVDGRSLSVRGLSTTPPGEHPTTLVVASGATSGPVLATVPTASLTWRPTGGVDPTLGLHEVTGHAIGLDAAPDPLDGRWPTAVADARRALAHQLVGTARTMLSRAREHALERVQFGRPIAGFQAVRHRLAETLVAIEAADAVLDASWLDGTPGTAAMAKAVAGREARTAARHAQQVLAGIGFTTEHDLHRYVRRALVLDGLFGTSASLTAAQGADLLEHRRLPDLLAL